MDTSAIRITDPCTDHAARLQVLERLRCAPRHGAMSNASPLMNVHSGKRREAALHASLVRCPGFRCEDRRLQLPGESIRAHVCRWSPRGTATRDGINSTCDVIPTDREAVNSISSCWNRQPSEGLESLISLSQFAPPCCVICC